MGIFFSNSPLLLEDLLFSLKSNFYFISLVDVLALVCYCTRCGLRDRLLFVSSDGQASASVLSSSTYLSCLGMAVRVLRS